MDAKKALQKYKDTEAARLRSYAKNAGIEAPGKYAEGGAVKSKAPSTTINIVVNKPDNPLAALAAMKPKPPPVTVPPPAPPQGNAPMPPMGAPGIGGISAGVMPGMKRGGVPKRAEGGKMPTGSVPALVMPPGSGPGPGMPPAIGDWMPTLSGPGAPVVPGQPMPSVPGQGPLKRGGKASKATALPMTAGAGSGPGRDQKSDSLAKKLGQAEPSMVMPKKKKA